jgi:hypothetical protein
METMVILSTAPKSYLEETFICIELIDFITSIALYLSLV